MTLKVILKMYRKIVIAILICLSLVQGFSKGIRPQQQKESVRTPILIQRIRDKRAVPHSSGSGIPRINCGPRQVMAFGACQAIQVKTINEY